MTIDDALLRKGLSLPLARTEFNWLGAPYEGKVRDNYSTADGRRIIVVSDRISAFDRVLGTLPFKGQVLNGLAAYWFEQTRSIVPNHVLSVPDPNVMECVECEPLLVEMVVRSYLTGVSSTSILTAYQRGDRSFCGHALPEGLKPHQRLPEPLLTPTTKAAHGEHDENVTREQIIGTDKLTAADFDLAAECAMKLFARGQQLCAERGLLLVDTKYEFGRAKDGRIMVIDEIHTPDSSRFWFRESYEQRMQKGETPESFDKEYLRRWLVAQGYRGEGAIPVIPDEVRLEASRRYIEACETIQGKPFVPDLEAPLARIERNLRTKLRKP